MASPKPVPATAPAEFTDLSVTAEMVSRQRDGSSKRRIPSSLYRRNAGQQQAIMKQYQEGDDCDTQSDEESEADPEQLVYFGCLSPQAVIGIFFFLLSAGIWAVAIYFGVVRKPDMSEMFSLDAWMVSSPAAVQR